jgi:hypothetical protein
MLPHLEILITSYLPGGLMHTDNAGSANQVGLAAFCAGIGNAFRNCWNLLGLRGHVINNAIRLGNNRSGRLYRGEEL